MSPTLWRCRRQPCIDDGTGWKHPSFGSATDLAEFSWPHQSGAQSLRKLLLDLLCPGCPIANLVIATMRICFATGQARQVSTIAPHANFRGGRCVLLLQFFAFRTTTRHAPSAVHCSLFVVVRIRSSQADLTAFLQRPSVRVIAFVCAEVAPATLYTNGPIQGFHRASDAKWRIPDHLIPILAIHSRCLRSLPRPARYPEPSGTPAGEICSVFIRPM
jgi:hypothetical protein